MPDLMAFLSSTVNKVLLSTDFLGGSRCKIPTKALHRRRRDSQVVCSKRNGGQPVDAKANEDSSDMDIVERIFTFFFGKKEAEPFGLRRFDRDRFPELYPATLDEFADAVDGDTDEIALFRPLLARTQLEKRALKLVFDADVHGWSAAAFHQCVDRKGASVGIMRTEKACFGFYNPKGWVGEAESRGSIAAFLFTWQDGDTTKPPVKLRKIGRAALACLDEPDSGPRMGADSLVVPLRAPLSSRPDAPQDKIARSKLGSYYERLSTGNNRSTLFGEGENPKGEMLTFLRVYSGVYEEGEEIPFNDVSFIRIRAVFGVFTAVS